LLATGLTTILGVQAFIILAGVTRVLPLTGVTLPFVSYGGSSLATTMFMAGVLLNVSTRAPAPKVDPLRRKRVPTSRNKMVSVSDKVVVIEQ